MTILLKVTKVIKKVNAILIKIPMIFFTKVEKKSPKIHFEAQKIPAEPK
jgi:hypothetical protein